MSDFLFTVPSGESVRLEPFNFAIIGQTQFSGKTTLIKRLSTWVVSLGYKVLIFDTKETEADYTCFVHEIPVCLRETTDALVLLPLLETVFQRRLPTGYYSVLCDVTTGTKNFEQVIAKAKEKEKTSRSGWVRGACRTLYDLLERLQEQLEKVETVPTLELPYDLNRMVLNDFPAASQQLFVKNAFEDLLHIFKRKTVGVIDEAFKFIPQSYSSAATKAIMTTITQGAKTGLFTWISTQFLAVTDKDPLKACAIKFLGTQDHITEVKHTLDLIPGVRGKFSTDDIMKLKVGHWILVRKRPPDVRVVYASPLHVPEKVGVEVAQGIRTPEYVRDNFLKVKMEVDEDLVWKEKYEEEKRKRKELEKEFTRQVEQVSQLRVDQKIAAAKRYIQDLEEENRTLKEQKSPEEIEELRKTVKELKLERYNLRKTYDITVKELKKLSDEAEALRKIKEALLLLLPKQPAGSPGLEPGSSTVQLQSTKSIVDVPSVMKSVTITDGSVQGKILTVARKGLLDKWRKLGEIVKAIIEESWTVSSQQVNNGLNDLVKQQLIAKKHTDRNYFRLAKNVVFKKEVEA